MKQTILLLTLLIQVLFLSTADAQSSAPEFMAAGPTKTVACERAQARARKDGQDAGECNCEENGQAWTCRSSSTNGLVNPTAKPVEMAKQESQEKRDSDISVITTSSSISQEDACSKAKLMAGESVILKSCDCSKSRGKANICTLQVASKKVEGSAFGKAQKLLREARKCQPDANNDCRLKQSTNPGGIRG